MKYRKKTILCKAVQWTGQNLSDVYNLTNGSAYLKNGNIIIKDVRGDRTAFKNDWIVLGTDFEIMSDYQFGKTYESME